MQLRSIDLIPSLRSLCCPLFIASAVAGLFVRSHIRHRRQKAEEKHEKEWKAKRAEDAVIPRDYSKVSTPLQTFQRAEATGGILSLPFEVRAMIWSLLLDGQILHIVRKEHGKLGYLRCEDQAFPVYLHPPTCWGRDNPRVIKVERDSLEDGIFRGRWEAPENDRTDGDLMALMRSCRTM